MVSMLRVEMYHIQLEIQSLLLQAELHHFTQEATQAARWSWRQFRARPARVRPHAIVPEPHARMQTLRSLGGRLL